jgi:ABC-type microcin C transport system permease subunit YejB
MELDLVLSLLYDHYVIYIAIYVLIHVITYIVSIPLWSAHVLYSDPKLDAKYSAFAR